MYKVERICSKDPVCYYEVMLSPFETLSDVTEYIAKYKQYYPEEDRVYKISEISELTKF